MSSDVDPAEYKVELSCDTDSVSSTEIFCPPHNSLNVTLFSLATNAEVHTFTLTKEQLHCMDGDVIDVFFKSENITVITNVTDPLNATASQSRRLRMNCNGTKILAWNPGNIHYKSLVSTDQALSGRVPAKLQIRLQSMKNLTAALG